jgi:hypothetical protein
MLESQEDILVALTKGCGTVKFITDDSEVPNGCGTENVSVGINVHVVVQVSHPACVLLYIGRADCIDVAVWCRVGLMMSGQSQRGRRDWQAGEEAEPRSDFQRQIAQDCRAAKLRVYRTRRGQSTEPGKGESWDQGRAHVGVARGQVVTMGLDGRRARADENRLIRWIARLRRFGWQWSALRLSLDGGWYD